MSTFVLMKSSVLKSDPLYVQEVREWQELLHRLGLLGADDVDGDFGPNTDAATRQFQRDRELEVDGKVGARTRASAEATAVPGGPPPKALPEVVDGTDLLPIPGSQKLGADFKRKVVRIAAELGVNPNFLMAVMAFESRFEPGIKNPRSSATGLIQFMDATAKDLGTTTAALARMSAVDQLDFVKAYFEKRIRERGKLKTIEDTYMAVLFPVLIGKPADAIFATKGGNSAERNRYRVNAGLDLNGDGIITKREAAEKVRRILSEAERAAGKAKSTAEDMAGTADPAVEPTVMNTGLRRGSPRGREVKEVQEVLVALGHLTQAQMNTAIGVFGPRTEAAVEEFQHEAGLDVTGVVTAETFAKLVQAVKERPKAEQVSPGEIATQVPALNEEDGYLTYGPRDKKYTRIGVLRKLEQISQRWKAIHPDRLVQIGNISKKGGGVLPPHRSHRNGLDVDFRPFRRDGRIDGVTIHDSAYDASLTGEFVDLLRKEVPGVKILFNDRRLVQAGKTQSFPGHDNHLHVSFPQ